MRLAPPSFPSSSAAPRDLHSFPTRRSSDLVRLRARGDASAEDLHREECRHGRPALGGADRATAGIHPRLQLRRSEEHTSELQSHSELVCRLLLEKKKISTSGARSTTCPATT